MGGTKGVKWTIGLLRERGRTVDQRGIKRGGGTEVASKMDGL